MTEICDYLVIGGSSAGCIVAKRLAGRSRGRIILLEAGKSDEGDPAACDLSRLDEQTADDDWGFKASTIAGTPPELNYRRARILGGCANHNDCAFLRPPGSDFEEWERLGSSGSGPPISTPGSSRRASASMSPNGKGPIRRPPPPRPRPSASI